jgi:PBP1b-binding outer membrane lipoprotein LpoB
MIVVIIKRIDPYFNMRRKIMKCLSLLLFAIILIVGCSPQQMTSEQIAAEKKAVESQITKFLDAYVTKIL